MVTTRIAAVLLAAALAPAAHSAVLYKSVGPNGVIEFSDTPPAGNKVIDQREVGAAISALPGMPAPGPATAPRATPMEALENDEEVVNASNDVDLAEHALALARRDSWSPMDGLKLRPAARTGGDNDRIEFYKRGVTIARMKLAEVMKRRAAALAVPGAPIVTAVASR